MKRKEITESMKNAILTDYRNRNIKQREIVAKYGIASNMLGKLLVEWGEPLRVPKKSSRNPSVKICPKCRKKNEIKGGKFCPYCGADMRTAC